MLHPSKTESLRKDKFFFFGLLAATFAASLAVLNQKIYTTPLIVAASAFAVAIPSLVLVVLAVTFEEASNKHVQHVGLDLASAFALLAVYVGYAALFWHVSWIAGMVATVSLVMATGVLMRLNKLVVESRKQEEGK